MKISVTAAIVLTLLSCVGSQIVPPIFTGGSPLGWSYFQHPYSPLLMDGNSYKDPSVTCLMELRLTSQRLKETSGIIGQLKSQLNALEKNTQRLAEKIVSGWVWTSKKFEETLQTSTKISNRLDETKEMVMNVIVYVTELITAATSSNSVATTSAATDIGRMPNNCLDLQLIGHKKSGLYSVIGHNNGVHTVYCDFSKRTDDPGFQKWIGYSDVKSSPTFFHVQKNVGFFTVDVPISFEVEKVNTGNAMDMTTGIFTTPKSGIYHFTFSGLVQFESDSSSGDLELRLYLNGDRIVSSYSTKSSSWSSVTSESKFNQINLQLSLKLQEFDRIWLEIHSHGAGVSLYDAVDWHHTHFTGLLVEEDFESI
uniref:C1q domain-containing protein n=1 Tax=Daphnia galeata TaxID=27404 RepID=A0A8J2RSG2_9CRUS|nr:unnamed protein product [Daphnia galeata]